MSWADQMAAVSLSLADGAAGAPPLLHGQAGFPP